MIDIPNVLVGLYLIGSGSSEDSPWRGCYSVGGKVILNASSAKFIAQKIDTLYMSYLNFF